VEKAMILCVKKCSAHFVLGELNNYMNNKCKIKHTQVTGQLVHRSLGASTPGLTWIILYLIIIICNSC